MTVSRRKLSFLKALKYRGNLKMKTKKWKELDFNYRGVIAEYNTIYECDDDASGCDSFCCRCGKIDTPTAVIDTAAAASTLVDYAEIPGDIQINVYCIERILSHFKMYLADSFFVDITSGYYGEEIGGISMDGPSELYTALDIFSKLKGTSAKIEFILKLEYDKVLPSILNRKWSIEKVSKLRLVLGNKKRVDAVKKEDCSMYAGWPLAKGIAIFKRDRYHLIDGYHRVQASDKDNILMLVGK